MSHRHIRCEAYFSDSGGLPVGIDRCCKLRGRISQSIRFCRTPETPALIESDAASTGPKKYSCGLQCGFGVTAVHSHWFQAGFANASPACTNKRWAWKSMTSEKGMPFAACTFASAYRWALGKSSKTRRIASARLAASDAS